MKRVLIASIVFMLASVALAGGLASSARALPARPAQATPVLPASLGLGLGTCYLDGTIATFDPNEKPIPHKSCLGVAPPPSPGVNCNPKGLTTSTLDVEHDVRSKVDLGGFATLYLWYSLGCGSVWGAVHVDNGCHTITDIQIADDTATNFIQAGLDANGVFKCAGLAPADQPWESTFMVPGFSGSHATASAEVDLVPQTASVTV